MKKCKGYRQCLLRKKVENGCMEQVSYIPEPFGVKGKILKLREDDGEWDDGWEVISAGELTDTDSVEADSRMYLKHRKNTDI